MTDYFPNRLYSSFFRFLSYGTLKIFKYFILKMKYSIFNKFLNWLCAGMVRTLLSFPLY